MSAADETSGNDLVAQHVAKVIVRHDRIEIEITADPNSGELGSRGKLEIPFLPAVSGQKAVTRNPINKGDTDPVAREKLLSWNEKTFASLSAVARAITGVRWNGRRFFGLQEKTDAHQSGCKEAPTP
ncbi:MAG: DUF2924 domain-containing protein [Methylobacteriaceae bacterium]|nr:DUF2924 domain-containing protein [Methylobacteriaceae bacterium]